MNKNGYFRVQVKETGRFLEIYPPSEGGAPVDFNEVRNYLANKGYPVDMVAINKAINDSVSGMQTHMLDNFSGGYPESEMFEIYVTNDNMRAVGRFYPPSEGGNMLDRDEIIGDLRARKIISGVNVDVIDTFLKERQYCQPYLLAEGTPPKEGKNGSIEYFFNTDHNTKPKLNDDGTVNFFELDLISPCKEGEVLARLTPAEKGEDGFDIFGKRVKPKDVTNPKFQSGNNLEVSEDGLELISTIAGNVSLVEGMVFVKSVYEVNDVDTSVGNIEYQGDVTVRGNVKEGFSIKSGGSVEVKGVVEGATIEAAEDIIIGHGMNGMGKGVITAGGNVVSKFIENARVISGGYVTAEAIIHSDVMAKTSITVNGKRGNITGGHVKAGSDIEAKTIGSTMGVETHVEVGADPQIKLKAQAMEQEIQKYNKALEQVKPILANFMKRLQKGDKLTVDQTRYFKELNEQYKGLTEMISKSTKAYNEYMEKIKDEAVDTVPTVKVSGDCFPGTVIMINDVTKEIKTLTQRTRFQREGADVRIKPLY
ncbi:MAG: FapA family protein [Lachnospiraceae bacterium]|nr:FapA family protein [Lachnospiraceae bacterium]